MERGKPLMSQAKAEPLTREIGARSKGGGGEPPPQLTIATPPNAFLPLALPSSVNVLLLPILSLSLSSCDSRHVCVSLCRPTHTDMRSAAERT